MHRALYSVVLSMMAILMASIVPAHVMGQDSLGFGDSVSVEIKRANQTDTETPGDDASQSGCLIATAAFGSELMPQVQFLRDFRDQRILSTAAGSSFMNVFNSWYYSFSPSVADYEREQPWMQTIVRGSIYPLLGILHVAERGYVMMDGEGGSVLSGFVASSLIGMVYLSPAAVVLRKKVNTRRLGIPIVLTLVASIGIIAIGAASGNHTLLMGATTLFVLSSIGLGIVAIVYIARVIEEFMSSTRKSRAFGGQ